MFIKICSICVKNATFSIHFTLLKIHSCTRMSTPWKNNDSSFYLHAAVFCESTFFFFFLIWKNKRDMWPRKKSQKLAIILFHLFVPRKHSSQNSKRQLLDSCAMYFLGVVFGEWTINSPSGKQHLKPTPVKHIRVLIGHITLSVNITLTDVTYKKPSA